MAHSENVSLWGDTMHSSPQFQALTTHESGDVCVVGGGISGLTTAYLLQKIGKKVILLEAREIAAGETSFTTAHLASALDDGFENLQKLFGEENAKLAVASHQAAIKLIEQIATEENIDCDFTWLNGYLFAGSEVQNNTLEKEYKAAQSLGYEVKPVVLSIPQLETKKAIGFAHQAQFHPLKYIYGLVKAFIKYGGKVYTHTKVDSVVEKGDQVLVTTHQGEMVTAQFAVVATNTPFIDRVAMHTKQAAYRSYVVALEIEKHAIPLGLYWDMNEPYHYVRVYERKESPTDVLIVGGEDHKTGQADNTEEKFQQLQKWAQEYFPQTGACLYQWSGQIMEPVDGLAFIGLNPSNKRIFIVTGDSGHGLTHGTLGAQLITDLIMGKENPWQQVYNPARKNVRAIKKFMHENLNVAKQYGAILKDEKVKDVKAIAVDSGAVIKKGRQKCAIYRDKKGTLHTMSAVCPHLGCIVQWNGAEKSWDCPCHGSRFDKEGHVLNGPATSDLEKL